jgi:hypothetical protein
MSLPNKLYINKFMIRSGMLHPAEFPPDNPEEEYIREGAIRALINAQIRREKLNFAALGGGGQTFCINTLEWVLKQLDTIGEKSEKPTNPICEGLEAADGTVREAASHYHFTTPSSFVAVMHEAGLEYEKAFAKEIETAFIRGAAWLAEQGVVEVGTMGDFGIRLDKSVVSRLAETFKEGDRVVVQYRLLNK